MLNEVAITQKDYDKLDDIKKIINKLDSIDSISIEKHSNGVWSVYTNNLSGTANTFIEACTEFFMKTEEKNNAWLDGFGIGDDIFWCSKSPEFEDTPIKGTISDIYYDKKEFEIEDGGSSFLGNFIDAGYFRKFFKTYKDCAEYIKTKLTDKYNAAIDALNI